MCVRMIVHNRRTQHSTEQFWLLLRLLLLRLIRQYGSHIKAENQIKHTQVDICNTEKKTKKLRNIQDKKLQNMQNKKTH